MYSHILKNRTLYHFYQICQIPHGSHNEKALSCYLLHWAESLGLDAYQDEYWNLIIKKPASPDRVWAAPVILQAHLDMVCDQEPESNFDFEKSGIPWNVDGDWISSAAGTTLGADCGIGVALILAVLEATDFSHPPIEAVLTTREETDMGGAYHLDFSRLTGRRMINLDVSPEEKLLAGSCGGAAVEFDLPINLIPAWADGALFRIAISGLEGGHSGNDITKGRGNALLMLGRLLSGLAGALPELALASIQGGNSRLAIPREASMLVQMPIGMQDQIRQGIQKFQENAQRELAAFPNISFVCGPVQEKAETVFDANSVAKLCQLLTIIPNGIQNMSNLIEGTVESSCNLGVIRSEGRTVHMSTEIRGTYRSTRQHMINQFETLAEIFNGSVQVHSTYHSWLYQPDSALRKLVQKVYYEREQRELDVKVAHAGNEIGIFYEAIEGLDAVAMGPTRLFYHSPKEKLSISSSIRFEQFLRQVLEELTD